MDFFLNTVGRNLFGGKIFSIIVISIVWQPIKLQGNCHLFPEGHRHLDYYHYFWKHLLNLTVTGSLRRCQERNYVRNVTVFPSLDHA